MMDREQFTSAVLAAEPTLYRVAKTMLRSEYDCADAAQQAMPGGRGSSWIRCAARGISNVAGPAYLINECSTILRRQQRLAPYDAAAAEAIPAPAADDYSDLYAAITALEEKLRLPVELYYLEALRYRRDCRKCSAYRKTRSRPVSERQESICART